jgi:RimJ/RimL family protein N-acetyltransferase
MASVSVQPAALPEHTVLEGRFVSVVPLDAGVHGQELYRATHGQRREDLWRYLSAGPFDLRSEFDDYLRRAEKQQDPLFFTITEKAANTPVGLAAYLRITPVHRVIEVGHLLFGPALQKTAGATEAMYLMAKYAFEDLRYRRYEWKCHALNVASRSAARRLGFTFEGIFRQHMIVKGKNRDTAWFAMLDSEWPACKAALEQWLDPSNFDRDGKQARPLASLRFNRQYGDCIR